MVSKNKNRVKESLPAEERYTYNDYLTWDDGQRYELIAGKVYNMVPAPSRWHQKISGALHNQFYNYLADKSCEVYSAPFDVRLNGGTAKNQEVSNVVQPDLVVVCDSDKLDEKGCQGAPDLIIEIVSPSSGFRDRKLKRDLYENYGVKEYWLVAYNEKTVEIYLLNDEGEYGKPEVYSEGDKIPVTIFTGLEVELESVFGEL